MKPNLLSFSEVPSDFQKDLFKKIAAVIKKGESVQLYGVTGSGNSLIVRALVQSMDIKEGIFKDNFFVILDGNTLLERTSIGLTRLILTLFPDSDGVCSSGIIPQNELDKKITKVCGEGGLVIVIDHMQELSSPELRPFFVNLYSIYRKLEPKLNFIFVFGKKTLSRNDLDNFGPMGRLIAQNVIENKGFNKKDGMWFIEEKAKQIGLKLTSIDKEKLFKLSGGFPRTLKRVVESLGRGYKLADIENDPSIDPLLSMHLEELAEDAQDLPHVILLHKYLSGRENTQKGESVGGLKIGKRLTKNEEKLLGVFLKNAGEIIGREEGIECLWGDMALDISDHAYDQLIHRLKNKLKGSVPATDIETVRGRGHLFKISN